MALDINNLMKEAQKMQEKMKAAQEDLLRLEVVGEAGAGLVKITMNGRHEVKQGGVFINPNLMDEDKEMIEDLVAAAINDAVRKIEKVSKDKIAELTAGLPRELQERTGSGGDTTQE
jgi:DNA-binding YbaB/EbfC family protein